MDVKMCQVLTYFDIFLTHFVVFCLFFPHEMAKYDIIVILKLSIAAAESSLAESVGREEHYGRR